jgi:hypothetical protein
MLRARTAGKDDGDNHIGRFDRRVVALGEESLPSWLLSETGYPRVAPYWGPG